MGLCKKASINLCVPETFFTSSSQNVQVLVQISLGIYLNPLYLKKNIRHDNTLTWPQNLAS